MILEIGIAYKRRGGGKAVATEVNKQNNVICEVILEGGVTVSLVWRKDGKYFGADHYDIVDYWESQEQEESYDPEELI